MIYTVPCWVHRNLSVNIYLLIEKHIWKAFKIWAICSSCTNKITLIKIPLYNFMRHEWFNQFESMINICLVATCGNLSCFLWHRQWIRRCDESLVSKNLQYHQGNMHSTIKRKLRILRRKFVRMGISEIPIGKLKRGPSPQVQNSRWGECQQLLAVVLRSPNEEALMSYSHENK